MVISGRHRNSGGHLNLSREHDKAIISPMRLLCSLPSPSHPNFWHLINLWHQTSSTKGSASGVCRRCSQGVCRPRDFVTTASGTFFHCHGGIAIPTLSIKDLKVQVIMATPTTRPCRSNGLEYLQFGYPMAQMVIGVVDSLVQFLPNVCQMGPQ